MIRRYRAIAILAMLVGAGACGLLVLASFGYLSNLPFADELLWPVVIGVLLVAIFGASWAIAKSKGRSGWLGLVLPFFDVIGLAVLFKLKDLHAERARRERGV